MICTLGITVFPSRRGYGGGLDPTTRSADFAAFKSHCLMLPSTDERLPRYT